MLEGDQVWNYNMGVPQGSSIVPVLWLLVIYEVFNMGDIDNSAYIQANIGDIVIMLRCSTSSHFSNMSKKIMENLETRENKYKLSFSKENTNYLMLKYLKEITHDPGIYLYGQIIAYAQ